LAVGQEELLNTVRAYRKLVEAVAGVAAAGGGVYLLTWNSAGMVPGSGESWFQVLAHGIGIYFVARGVWMFSHAGSQEDVIDRLDRLIDLQRDEEHDAAPDARAE
jgi:hypothetical protein